MKRLKNVFKTSFIRYEFLEERTLLKKKLGFPGSSKESKATTGIPFINLSSHYYF